ncbi:MAG: DPP IV N-terminal domain-containing protein [Planctomycetota bacterium]
MPRVLKLLVLALGLMISTPNVVGENRSFDEAYMDVDLLRNQMRAFNAGGRVSDIYWSPDGNVVSYTVGSERFRLDLATMNRDAIDTSEDRPEAGDDGPRRRRPARGRQRAEELSPDGLFTAICRDYNVVIRNNESRDEMIVTTDGTTKLRYGMASWVYGEELDQTDAMFWSPDSSRLAFYQFDESGVQDFYLLGNITTNRTTVLREGYPKPGEANPVASLRIFDVASERLISVDTALDDDHYVYNVRFTPNGDALMFSRTNRHQNVLEIMVAEPSTGDSRIVLTERQDTWQNNRPLMRFLDDGERFIWETEKSGWSHYELRHLDGRLINPLTTGHHPVDAIVEVDEAAGWLYYTAYSDSNPLNRQLHRVRLDGTGQQRLTQESAHHTARLSPDRQWFITTYETVNSPPETALYGINGERAETLTAGDDSALESMSATPAEAFTCLAADGTTVLHGILYYPPSFDASKQYPLVMSVYGGPGVNVVRNRYNPVRAETALGCFMAMVDNRGTPNRGKAFESATYLQLGVIDLDDQVAAVRELSARPYIDSDRVGIVGHSYGGYMAALAMVRYPDVFAAGVARAPVTDWRQYDTIYTERYMRTPQENESGYDAGSAIKHVKNLTGELLLMHGLQDDNVHPTNAWQFIDALDRAGKPYESRFLPRAGHSFGHRRYHWSFLHRHLMQLDAS